MKMANVKTETYSYKNAVYVDIVSDYDEKEYSAWVYNKTNGIKSLMFSVPMKQQSYEEYVKIVSANVNEYYHDYIKILEGLESMSNEKLLKEENNSKVKYYSLYNYFDVWGNETDGWEINNQCVEFDDLYLADDVSEDEVIDYLIQIDFLVPNAKELVEIDNSYADGYEIIEKETGRPICGLRPNCY